MHENHFNKNPTTAGLLALLGGPLGFLYVGWRYGVTATGLFAGVIFVVAFLLPVPSWLVFVNLPVFGLIAYRVCEKLNGLIDEGLHRGAAQCQTWPVATFAMTSSLPLLAAANAAAMGVVTTFSQFMGGSVGSALITLLVVTPLFAVVNFVLGVVIAAGIDRWVSSKAPAAPRHIFPPAIAVGE